MAPDLLGLPLAAPGRRFWALILDLVLIGLITLLTKSFALVLGIAASVFFIRAGLGRTQVRRSVFGRAMRASVGCLGIVVGLITAFLWASYGLDFGRDGDAAPAVVAPALRGGVDSLATALAAAGLEAALREAVTLEDAEEAVDAFAEGAGALGVPRERILQLAVARVPEDASWADRAPDAFARRLGLGAGESDAPTGATEGPRVAESADRGAEDDSVGAAATAGPLPDTVFALQARLRALQDSLRAARVEAERLRARLERQRRGVVGSLTALLDELGFGFGWATLYLTVFLSWWNGQTPGKRALGIRVVRLDGEPINWWVAFERAGGYAAGLATGLLGFAQVYWDANRQAIHDRIVGTVVVRDGQPRVEAWEDAL